MSEQNTKSVLNGWQKMWLILTALWVLIVVTLSIIQHAPIYSASGLTTLVLLMFVPCAVVYVLGLLVQHFMLPGMQQQQQLSKKEK